MIIDSEMTEKLAEGRTTSRWMGQGWLGIQVRDGQGEKIHNCPVV